MDDDHFFFGYDLDNIDWANFFNEKYPGLSYLKREFILNVAQSASINPIVLLTSIILQNEDNSVEIKESDYEFHSRLSALATGLKNEYYKNKDPNVPAATYAVWMSVDRDSDKLKEFLEVFALLDKRLETPGHSSSELSGKADDYDDDDYDLNDYDDDKVFDDTEELALPFPHHECWDIGR